MCTCVKLSSLVYREMKFYYVTQVLKQGINIKVFVCGQAK